MKDVGWSWLVLGASFIVNGIVFGQLLCFGIYLVVLRDHFDASRSEVAFIGSVAYGTKCLTGFVASVACRKFGCRPVLMLSGVVTAAGFLLSFHAASITHLVLSYGLLSGFGFGLAFTPSLAVLPDYFERWKYFATAFATVGAACGTFVFQPIFYYLIETFTWRGSMLINAGIVLQITVCGSLMKSHSSGGPVSFRDLLETSLFTEAKMWLMLGNCACWGAAVYSTFSMLNLLVLDIGLTRAESAQIASAVGLANVFGRTSASFLGQANLISRPLYYTLASFALSIGALAASAFKVLVPTMIALVVFGLGFGSMMSQLAGVLIHLFSVKRLVNALGYCVYRWFVTKLTEFERSGTSNLFPTDWEMGRRLTNDFCITTREMLDRLMTKRAAELDSKLLTHAINHTAMFEALLCKRFPGKDGQKSQFEGLVWRAFERHMHVFVAAQDKNMTVFLEQCANRIRSGEDRPVRETSAQAYPLPSSGDMFVFFKRTIREATKLSTNSQKILADLAPVFKKCLRGYAHGCLTAFLPKLSGSSVQGTAGLLQSLLKEGEVPRLNKDEQFLTCCILATADWCAETTQQLQDKLREKVSDAPALDMSTETDLFYTISSSALTTLATDLEIGCDAALQTMTKINWSTIENVGDESAYVASIRNHLKINVPLLRDFLADRRKYFGHLCLKFATTFMSKYGGTLFRCRPISVSGAEQLLLDTHALKTFLLNLPSVESAVSAKPPTAYVKVVNKAMTKAEMILKIVMSDIESSESFVLNYAKLLPESDASEFQKVLEMKAVRRSDQTPLIEMYRSRVERTKSAAATPQRSDQNLAGPLMSLASEDSRIRKLERLVKKKL
uniref:Vacuolar protein sorting-associated protein 53 homolog n=1 Tax=Plectus sambesii TaxID=2011161 RepID=A0A914WH53_9BILA